MLGWGAVGWVAGQLPHASIACCSRARDEQTAERMFMHFTTSQATFIPRLAHALSDLGLVRTCRLL